MKQPGNIGVGEAATFIVGLFDYKNNPVSTTGLTGSFSASLVNSLGTVGAYSIDLVNGKYDNSKPAARYPVIVNASGSFMITVADQFSGSAAKADGISPITSLAFQVIPSACDLHQAAHRYRRRQTDQFCSRVAQFEKQAGPGQRGRR
jgi:hypothetical protein